MNFNFNFTDAFNNNISDMLNPQESVNDETRIHWWIFVIPGLIFIFGFYLFITSGRGFTLMDIFDSGINWITTNTDFKKLNASLIPDSISSFLYKIKFTFRLWISWLVMLIGLIKIYRSFISYMTTILFSTEQRVVVKTGLFSVRTVEIPNNQIDGLDINQSIFGRILDFGSVIIHSSGGISMQIPFVISPIEFRKNIIPTNFSSLISEIPRDISQKNNMSLNTQNSSKSSDFARKS